MKVDELKSQAHLLIRSGNLETLASVIKEPATGKLYVVMTGSGIFPGHGDVRLEITPALAKHITLNSTGVPVLEF
jgi:hypothetical protein